MKLPVISNRERIVGEIIEIPLDRIVPNVNQPRRLFDETELNSLAESINQNGLIQPVTVRSIGDNFEIVAGERRFRAAQICGLKYLPCIVVDIEDSESAVMALVENIQRKELSFFEEAYAIRKMMNLYGLTQEETALRLGKTQSTVANKLRLLRLSDEEQKKICDYDLTERHARALLKVSETSQRLELIEKIHKFNFNVERTEKEIDKLIENVGRKSKIKKRSNLFKHMSLFANSIDRAVEIMKESGVECSSERINSDDCVEFIIKISKSQLYD